jgi:hypothetical protein
MLGHHQVKVSRNQPRPFSRLLAGTPSPWRHNGKHSCIEPTNYSREDDGNSMHWST